MAQLDQARELLNDAVAHIEKIEADNRELHQLLFELERKSGQWTNDERFFIVNNSWLQALRTAQSREEG